MSVDMSGFYPFEQIPDDYPSAIEDPETPVGEEYETKPGEADGFVSSMDLNMVAMPGPGSIKEPLYVANVAADEMSAGQIPVTNVAQKVVSFYINRTGILLTNTSSTVTINIGATPGQAIQGYPIPPGVSLTLPLCDDIYAYATAPATLAYISLQKALIP